ncbi:MAG: ABC transporter ATP-binding protein [Oscillospiraceae bacterium]|nr:ABC transporter ATP-binding protein [Oscillospiraceae bacterium]
MSKLTEFTKGYRHQCVLGPLFKLLEALFELFVPMVVADMIDSGIMRNDMGYIVKSALLMGVLSLAGLAFSVTAQYFAASASVNICARMRHALFEKIGTFSHVTLNEMGASTLITRLTSDMNQVQSGINIGLRLLLRSPFVVFGAIIMAFRIDPKSAMIFVYVTIALFVVVYAVILICIRLYRDVQVKLDRVTGLTRENLTGTRVLRAFRKEKDEQRSFDEANTALMKIQLFTGRISSVMNPVTFALINTATMFLIYFGGVRAESGVITTGALIALYNYMAQILVELVKLANLSINIAKSIACAKRINAVLDTDGAMREGDTKVIPDDDTAVEFDDVTFTYPGAADSAVTGITFRAGKGETVGIIGGTGSGKSSVVNLIPRFYDVTSGKIRIFGRDITDYSLDALRMAMGIVPQKAVLFSGTVRENILWGNSGASDEDIMRAAETAQAVDVINAKGGLDGVIEAKGANLSGGQRQRLTIARALVRRPRILILDDSASALDMATDARLRKALAELDFKPTVFIVSQRVASIMGADRIIVMDDGVISDMGSHEELLERCGLYREIYEMQTGGT